MLANYTYELGAVTPVGNIIEHAVQAANENTAGSALSSTSLGFIVKDSWGDAVIEARRGPRKQLQNVYLNVKKKDPTHHSGDVDGLIPLSQALADLTVPDDWKVVRDKPHYWCIVRVEAWEVNNARVSTEIVIDKDGKTGLSFVSVKAHGCQKDLSNIPGFAPMSYWAELIWHWTMFRNTRSAREYPSQMEILYKILWFLMLQGILKTCRKKSRKDQQSLSPQSVKCSLYKDCPVQSVTIC